jgi:multiple sugar transport system permease protein
MRDKKYLILLLPGLFGVLLFFILPFIYTVYYALTKSVFDSSFAGLQNFIDVINNEYFRIAFKNTFLFSFTAAPLIVVYSFFVALLFNRVWEKLKSLKYSFFLPILLPVAAIAPTFLPTEALFDLTFVETGRIALYLFFIWKNSGYCILLFLVALRKIDKTLYEAAMLDGAGAAVMTAKITVPMLFPVTFFISVLSLMNSLKIFKEVYIWYGNYPEEEFYMLQHYINNNFSKLNYQILSAATVIFFAIIFVFIFLGVKFEKNTGRNLWEK